jgi:hypothetical protein
VSEAAFFSDLLRNLRGGARLAALRPVAREEIVATPEALALLVGANLVVLFLLGYAQVGTEGQFDYLELPRALMIVLLLLALGLLVARASSDPEAMLVLPVALMAAGTTVSVVIGAVSLLAGFVDGMARHWRLIHYFTHAWWILVIAVTVSRLVPADTRRRIGNIVAGLVLVALPGWLLPQGALWVPAYDAGAEAGGSRAALWALAEEKGFYAQQEALSRALASLQPERRGIPDLYVIAAGLYAAEDVFMKEVQVIETLFRERFDAHGRTLALINNPKTVRDYPVASVTSLSATLRRVGSLMNPEEDVLVLYVSSHGSETHQLSVDFWPLRLDPVDPPALRRALDASGIKWKVIVISACYSGGFIEPLRSENTLIITASSASKRSFGCGSDSDSTYLARALFDEELRETYSFEEAFRKARESIGRREREQNHEPSEPQIHVGAAMRGKLGEIEKRLAALAAPRHQTREE